MRAINVEADELVFNNEIIANTENEEGKISADPAQEELLDSLTEIIAEIIPISRKAIRGFTWKLIEDWQQMRRITITELEGRPIIDKINAAREIIKQAKKFYVSLLVEATPIQKYRLEKEFDNSIKLISNKMRAAR